MFYEDCFYKQTNYKPSNYKPMSYVSFQEMKPRVGIHRHLAPAGEGAAEVLPS